MALIVGLTSHHRRLQRKMPSENANHCSPKSSNHFCNKIGQQQTHALQQSLQDILSTSRP
jgi:hypothetical protein